MQSPIFTQIVPATIITSHCLGDARNTPAPNLSISKRGAPVLIISIAQQARPKVRGQREEALPHFNTLSPVVRTIPPPGNFSISPEAGIFSATAIRALLSSRRRRGLL